MWIFGYGSLIWRPDFDFVESAAGYVDGYKRRFWQGSTDHRGVPGAPGRVVTLIPETGSRTWGRAYRIEGAVKDRVLAKLDHRESGGYERHRETFFAAHPPDRVHRELEDVLVYLAGPSNPNYIGAEPEAEIAAVIDTSVGPSGPNDEYLLRLAQALREMGADDPHVFELEAALRARRG